jgi:hypothetical protein
MFALQVLGEIAVAMGVIYTCLALGVWRRNP